jgi:hypothetical protein
VRLWYWQGLRWVPAGLVLLSAAAAAAYWSAPGRWVSWVVTALLGARLYRLIDRFYVTRFGRMRAARGPGWLIAVTSLTGAIAFDVLTAPPLLVTAAASAIGLLAFNALTGGGRPHHRWGVAVFAALAVLPAVGADVRSAMIGWLVAAGVLAILLGVLDHRELVRIGVHRARTARGRDPVPGRASRPAPSRRPRQRDRGRRYARRGPAGNRPGVT